jgi:D-arabinose 1-dehydrogenase-like Zn-dependent alcohol dehydrogenase
MAIEFTVFKGSRSGDIVEAKGSREVGPTEALIKITHSGVCFTDEHYRHIDQGLGHEGVGTIVEVGSRVHEISDFKVGDRVGMGWFQKFCGHCKVCVRGTSKAWFCQIPIRHQAADADFQDNNREAEPVRQQ